MTILQVRVLSPMGRTWTQTPDLGELGMTNNIFVEVCSGCIKKHHRRQTLALRICKNKMEGGPICNKLYGEKFSMI